MSDLSRGKIGPSLKIFLADSPLRPNVSELYVSAPVLNIPLGASTSKVSQLQFTIAAVPLETKLDGMYQHLHIPKLCAKRGGNTSSPLLPELCGAASFSEFSNAL